MEDRLFELLGREAEVEIVFREVRTREELRSVLAMRYLLYNGIPGVGSRLRSLDHQSRLELDPFDLFSHHFGLYARLAGEDTLVGTLRLSSEIEGRHAGWIREVCDSVPRLRDVASTRPSCPLPLLAHAPQAAAIEGAYQSMRACGLRVAEAGRLCVHPALRLAAGRRALRASHFLIESAEAFAWYVDCLDAVLIECDVRLEGLYRHFGFLGVPGGAAAPVPGLGLTMTVLVATPDALPQLLRPKVEDLAGQYRECGEARQRIVIPNRDSSRILTEAA